MAQTAACNRHDSLDQQLCRWLLLSLDRLQNNELVMTQELIANMLGVRREGVTDGALKLQHEGLIRYARGRITVLNRPGLERRTCECYAVVKKEYDRLLSVPLAVLPSSGRYVRCQTVSRRTHHPHWAHETGLPAPAGLGHGANAWRAPKTT